MGLVLFLTLIETAFGMTMVHLFIPRSALGPGFGKTISATCFFCLLFPLLAVRKLLPEATVTDALHGIRLAGGAALAIWFAYFTALNYPKEGIQRALVAAAFLAQAALVALTAAALAKAYHAPGAAGAYGPSLRALFSSLLFGMVASAFLMGSVTMAMLIGHWYLVIPGLAIRWLKGGCLAFGAALAIKAASIGLSLALGAMTDPFGASGFMDRYILPPDRLMIFSARVAVGILISGALAFMAYRAAAIHSTQSSTGILFPAMITVYLGEMIGVWLIIGLGGLAV